MRTLALVLAAVVLCVVVTPAYAQEPSVQFPKDGNGLLDYCNHSVNSMDSPLSEASSDEFKYADNVMKQGWCAGYIQATLSLINDWRIKAAVEIISATNGGKPAPAHMRADQNFVGTCLPYEASVGQLARVLVKWLHEHPERLHEPDSTLTLEALKDAFPCQADAATKESVTK